MSLKKKRILIAPLNWGLGHATRCIPIIRKLLQQEAEVIIAADGHPLALLKQEFPQLTFIDLPGYAIRYPSNGNMALAMLWQLPKIARKIKEEHKALQQLIDQYNITGVISDNRYGLWTHKVPCVFITHQILVKCPPMLRFMEFLIYRINLRFIKRYTHCWIPDIKGADNLSGVLAHQYRLPENATYIGPLSRFSGMKAESPPQVYEIMAIVSGPEPQRSIFEQKLLEQLSQLPQKSLLVKGLPGKNIQIQVGPISIMNHLDAQQMLNYMSSAAVIISRTGYSTIMDLVTIGKSAILVPTPGQTEQEYLAAYVAEKGFFATSSQDALNIKALLKDIANNKTREITMDRAVLQGKISSFINAS